MKEKVFTIVLSAIVGAVVGATVVFLIPQNKGENHSGKTHFDEITVKKINVSDTLYLWPEGKDDPDLVMTQGGILARTRLIATQLCGNVVMGNAVFTTPDNPQNQIDQCRIYTEMGSNPVTGGGLIVRSVRGANVLSQGGVISQGYSYNIGYNENEGLMGYALDNSTQERAVMALVRPTSNATDANPEQQPASPTEHQEGFTSTAAVQQPSTQQYQQQQNPPMVAQPLMEAPRN